jgi:hypothetical protein
MTRLRSLIKEVLSQPKKKDCNCGCNTCGDKAPILTEGKFKSLISEGLQHHIDKKISLFESVYRIGSEKHLELIREARALWVRGIIEVSDDDKGLLETHLGHFGLYEGVEVPLDLPMVNEETGYGADTAWTDEDGNKVTLQDILKLTKNIPQKDYPTEKLAKIVLNWDDNPKEVERIDQVEVSKQYPILIMVGEDEKIKWILDGNHRAQKALRSNSETIPAKLIKPSNLSSEAKKILLGVVDESLNEEVDEEGFSDKIIKSIIKPEEVSRLSKVLNSNNIPFKTEKLGKVTMFKFKNYDDVDKVEALISRNRIDIDEGFYSSPSDLEDSGLNVIPKNEIHFNKLKDALRDSSLYAEENEAISGREGYFFFPEEEDGYDQLEMEIQELMDDYNIQGYIEGVFEESLNEEKKYFGVFQKGGSIGQGKDEPLHSFVDKEEAKQKAKRLRQTLTPGEKSYYRMGYIVRPTNVAPESLNEEIVDYDFSKEELIRVIKQLKRGASDEVGMIKAFEKALGRELTDDEIRGFKIDPSKVGRGSLEERINNILEAKKKKKKAKKKKKDPPLNKPKRGGSKAYYVYVRDPKTKKIKKVSFGSGGLRAKIKNKEARNAFAARHNCKNKKDRTKAGYWSCNLPRYAEQLGLGSKMNTFW